MPDLEPITRLEEYLSKLAGDDVAVPEPITRVEKFLAYIAGEADSKPTPITRVEKFLDAIGQGGGGGGGGETVIVPEQTVEAIESGGLYQATLNGLGHITLAQTYKVEYDSMEYELEATELFGRPFLGEGNDQGPDFTNYPFAILDQYTYIQMYAGTGGEHTVKITQLGGASAVIIEKNITANGDYDASSDSADGYNPVHVSVPNSYSAGDEGKVVSSGALVTQTAATYTVNSVYDTTLIDEVTVNVSGGGGGSSYTLISSVDVPITTVSTTSTTATTITLSSDYYNTDAIIYVKIRDKAGKRADYALGSDAYVFPMRPANSPDGTNGSFTTYPQVEWGLSSSNIYQGTTGGYGVYVSKVQYHTDKTADIIIASRYNSSYGTIDGTYNVSVYLLDYAPNQGNPFNYSY